MKILYLATVMLFPVFNSFAQPTITGAQLNLIIGEQITYSQGNNISHLPNGSNQTWDFSSVTATSGTVTFTMIPSDASHPGSNIAYDYGGGNLTYCQFDATQQSLIYQKQGSVLTTYSDPMKTLVFPLSSSTNFTDVFTATYNNGIAYTRQGSLSVTYEGYGTVITSIGTYSDCIKTKTIRNFTDTHSGGTINYSIEVYQWYKAGYHIPIFIIGSTTIGNDPPFQYSQFFVESTLGIKENSIVESALYPNPTKDEITLVVENNGNIDAVKVYDMKGQLVRTQTIQQSNGQTKLDVQGLESGFYIIEAQLSSGSIAHKKFQKI